MDGLVSLLDQRHHDRVQVLFDILEDRCGLRGIQETPYPHFSWQVAESFNTTTLATILSDWAEAQRPFQVQTNGLGLFSGPDPVLYLPVIRTVHLNNLHGQLWRRFSELRRGESGYYAPDVWMPHITIAMGDLTRERLGCALRLLARQAFEWTITINNVAVLFQSPGQQARLGYRFDFPPDDQKQGE